jgi:hypothetical protein
MGWVFDLPGRRGNVTAIKDDGAIELTRPIIKKLSLQDLYPPPARIVPSRRGRWGGSTTSSPMDLDIAEKNFASATSTPPAGEETSRVEEDDWGGHGFDIHQEGLHSRALSPQR